MSESLSDPTGPSQAARSQVAAPSGQFPDPIPGIIPFGTVTLFAGAPGVGKTAMLAEWCRRWRDGLTICGKPTHPPTGFYYLAADRQWSSHAQWFNAVGFGEIPHYSLADDQTLSLSTIRDALRAHETFVASVAKLKPIPGSHLFVDPVSPLFIGGDANKSRDVAASLVGISRIAQEWRINITCAAHFGKQKTDPNDRYARPQDRISGSGAFVGFSDTQIYLIDPVPPKQPYHILGWNPRHAPLEEFHFKRNEQGLFIPFDLFSELDRRERALLVVPETPTSTHMLIGLIHGAIGLSLSQCEEYLYSLVAEGRVTKIRRGFYKRTQPS